MEGKVPAKVSEDSSPKLSLVTAENSTVEFIVGLPEQNQKCQVDWKAFNQDRQTKLSCGQVEKYEVKYISLGAMQEQEHRELDATEVAEDGTLVIEDFPGAGDKAMRLEARIVYTGGVASPWISSKEPVSDHSSC